MTAKSVKVAEHPFVSDVQELRRRAREHMEQGAVTSAYRADRETVIRILNEVLATELVCVLRYKRHYYMATGIHAQAVAEEFLEHANEEQIHADLAAERITQLGGEPDFNPEVLAKRSHSQFIEGKSLLDMVREDLIAERIAVASYTEIIQYLGNDDPTTRIMIEQIMSKEEEHADDRKKFLETLGGEERRTEHKKCAHPSCHCKANGDSSYCSTYCEGGAKTADIICSCGHPGCAQLK